MTLTSMRQKVKSKDNSVLIYELYLATKNFILATKRDLNGLSPYFPKTKVNILLNLCNNNVQTLV